MPSTHESKPPHPMDTPVLRRVTSRRWVAAAQAGLFAVEVFAIALLTHHSTRAMIPALLGTSVITAVVTLVYLGRRRRVVTREAPSRSSYGRASLTEPSGVVLLGMFLFVFVVTAAVASGSGAKSLGALSGLCLGLAFESALNAATIHWRQHKESNVYWLDSRGWMASSKQPVIYYYLQRNRQTT
jgi:hypothetical protein